MYIAGEGADEVLLMVAPEKDVVTALEGQQEFHDLPRPGAPVDVVPKEYEPVAVLIIRVCQGVLKLFMVSMDVSDHERLHPNSSSSVCLSGIRRS